jgi:hypothetical protein
MKKILMVLSIVSIMLTGCTSTYESISLSEIKKEIETNSIRAEETYNKKAIEITGKITSIDKDAFAIEDNEGNDIICFLSGVDMLKTQETLKEKNIGDTVTVQGVIETNGHYLNLDKSIIK